MRFSSKSTPRHPTRSPHILLCSAWQVVNIGDIAHTPAALALLEAHFPEAQVTLWPFKPLTPAATALIMRRFPHLQIVEGTVHPDGVVSTSDLQIAMDKADFFLHSSGPAMLGWDRAEAFHARAGRPFGVYGVTYGLYGIPEKATLSRARFVYFRDSVSLEAARRDGVHPPLMEWAPDVAFATDLRDDTRADAFLQANGLEEGQFLCCISRLRNTPFWQMSAHQVPFDEVKHARNEAMKVHDHAPLIEAIIMVTRQTSLKVLICPEDETQMEITRDNLLAHLPDDVWARVVWRDKFWLPDEALSVYRRSAGLFGHEMHSPIMCLGNGIPAIVCRWSEQSTKGYMWRDIGLGEWLFDFDCEDDCARLPPTVLALAQDPAGAKVKAERARERVLARFAETMSLVRREVWASQPAEEESS
ncbi:hypothetical protein IAD21_00142 [Abditibacteriota bacterium]|nr:hypothetical protein IAD21_00142 [Abditibacteriota bacterium]